MVQVIETAAGTIEYAQYGTGIPLLFVHGGHSNCRETLFHKGFDPDQFCLLTPTRPGYGKTPLAGFSSPKNTAVLLISLLNQLNIQQAIVIGISAGGLTAIELAANYPDRVKKLILVSAVTQKWMTDRDENYVKGKKLFSPAMERYSWAMFRFFYAVIPRLMAKTMFQELSTVRPAAFNRDEVRELQEMTKKQRSGSGFVNDLDQQIDPSELSKIVCPTLILHSLNDGSVSRDHAEHAKQNIPNSLLQTYENRWGHLLWLGEESRAPIEEALGFIHS